MQKHSQLDKLPAQFLKGVGPEIGKLLQRCQINTVQDILFHLPYRYQDRTKITLIKEARAGESIVIEGELSAVNIANRRLICELSDSTGTVVLLFFNMGYRQKANLYKNMKLRCFGEIKISSFGLTLIHPEYIILTESHTASITESLTAIYSSTEGLTQNRWRRISEQALLSINAENLPDYLAQFLNPALNISLHHALKLVHQPPPEANMVLLNTNAHPAQHRLAFEELLAHHLSLKYRKNMLQKKPAPCFDFLAAKKNLNLFFKNLPFELTNAQQKVYQEILADLAQPHPMLRLVQGDVGCGKTIVAAAAALLASSHHYQTAFMAPTELLSEQHYENFQRWCAPLNIPVVWLRSQSKLSEKKQVIQQLQEQDNIIAIGTHALFQEKIIFKKLGLVMIDEQHRFGVEQRLALKQKGYSPHQLMLTATPIPRTLAMTCYADLNISIIDALPPNRTPVKTAAIPDHRRKDIIARIRAAYAEKRQIYWVCTLIEESEQLQSQAAETTAVSLKNLLPELSVGLIHGKLTPSLKETRMRAFKQGEIDLLVSTTVIEVGVDVPNASVMIIENAERLGLAQLHQLRGRVGRGNKESYCILLYSTPLSPMGQERLQVMRDTNDGFIIAEKDLALRGAGELMGTRQTGAMNLQIADLARDQHLFEQVQRTAEKLFAVSPEKVLPIISRWLGDIHEFQGV